MLIERKSPRTGQINRREIDVTEDQLRRWQHGHELIQNVMPHISKDDREFLMTGYTPEDWDAIFCHARLDNVTKMGDGDDKFCIEHSDMRDMLDVGEWPNKLTTNIGKDFERGNTIDTGDTEDSFGGYVYTQPETGIELHVLND